MADVNFDEIMEPAATQDLVTLDEAKLMLGISLTDTTQDDQLAMMISVQSAIVADTCNCIFGRERLTESWREIETDHAGTRVFLTHWPVKLNEIELVTAGGDDYQLVDGDWTLEERSGKLSNYGGWFEPVIVTYTGGYDLPTEAPLPLKQATILMIREQRRLIQMGNLEGIRMIGHKGARVMFHAPNQMIAGGTAANPAQVSLAIQTLLKNYIRLWV